MVKKSLLAIIWMFVWSTGYAQISTPLGFCNHSTVIYPDTIHQDYNNIKRFLGKYEAKLSFFQQKALAQEFKTQVCWGITPTRLGWANYKQLLDLFGILIAHNEKEAWITKAREEIGKREDMDDAQREFGYIQEAIENEEPAYEFLERPMVLDFDKNQVADVICIPQAHFGPASGFEIYAKKKGRWQSVADYSGSFEGFKKTENQIVIRYLVADVNSNAQVLANVVLEKKENDWAFKDCLKQLYAYQTQEPPKLLHQFEALTVKSNTIIRTHPFVKNTGMVDEKTPTLAGNQVAVFPKGSQALILAKLNDWAFVAFLPSSNPEKTSFEYESDPNSDIKPYYCGWIALGN